MLSIIMLTLKESFRKKFILVSFLLSTFFCLLLLFSLNMEVTENSKVLIQFIYFQNQEISLVEALTFVEGGIAVIVASIGLFLAIFATSDLMASLFRKGNIESILAKPISRAKILLGRYLGAVIIVSLSISYLFLLSWIILSFKFDLWISSYLLSGLIIILVYAIFYAFLTLLTVLSNNATIAAKLSYGLMLLGLILDPMYSFFSIGKSDLLALLPFKIASLIIPKMSEIMNIVFELAQNNPVATYLPLYTSLGFGTIMILLAIYFFKKKDY